MIVGYKAADLRSFELDSLLRFEDTPSGLVRAVITTPSAEASVYIHGAHVATWTPAGQQPVLYLSPHSEYDIGRPIRGGVPIVFPWFAARENSLPGPSHGFARILPWGLEKAEILEGGDVFMCFLLKPTGLTKNLGYDHFQLQFRITIGTTLQLELEIRNTSSESLKVEEALHNYFAVSDVRQVSVSGPQESEYIDRADNSLRKHGSPEAIRFSGETDRLFLSTENTCTIEDPGWQRRIVIEKKGSQSTVVWNPWAEKAAALSDLGGDQWPHMVCVEAANARDNAIAVPPGSAHVLEAVYRVEPLQPTA